MRVRALLCHLVLRISTGRALKCIAVVISDVELEDSWCLRISCKSRECSRELRRKLKRKGSKCRKEPFESSSFGMNTVSNSRALTPCSTYHGLVVGYVVQEVAE
jgi:hypothetical protein